jgi:hypothetical protein
MRAALLLFVCLFASAALAAGPITDEYHGPPFPIPLDQYQDAPGATLGQTLAARAAADPFNVVATIIFALAIIHTFLAPKFMKIAHHWRDEHAAKVLAQNGGKPPPPDRPANVSFKAEMLHFLGEVEAIFGIWVVPLIAVITIFKGWEVADHYISGTVSFTEPMFVVVIMTIAATRPILRFAQQCMSLPARLGGYTPAAWWLSILTIGPLLGSFITEPGAMTICALLLARQFYDFNPSIKFRYATIGLLFVNVSVGGTLTHFAAPPVLIVAGRWGWDMPFMFVNFGWKAAVGIVICNLLYYSAFRREFRELAKSRRTVEGPADWSDRADPVPGWVTAVHMFFLVWTVFNAHHAELFVGGFLFFLAFAAATEHHQNRISLRPALLVGFFLAGLVIHGGLQGWWIAPVLAQLTATPLLLGASVLTAFNDNAAITYLASLVPNFTDSMKYAVVAGAVAGGGLTVIANAPNPAGQSILSSYFGEDGISPLRLLLGALIPTIIMLVMFLVFRPA